MAPHVYFASDYAGMKAGDFSFYFGYEELVNDEWAFVAKHTGIEVMRVPQSKLGKVFPCEPHEYLLCGIAMFIESHCLFV